MNNWYYFNGLIYIQCGFVPGISNDVEIMAPFTTSTLTVTSGAVTVNNLRIDANAFLDVNGFGFTCNGTFTNFGTIRFNGSESAHPAANDTANEEQ